GVGAVEMLGVADAQLRLPAQFGPALLGDLQHGRAELRQREAHPGRIEREVPARARGDLENLALGLRADPLAPPTKQDPLEEADLTVIARGLALEEVANSFGFTDTVGRKGGHG